MMDDMNDTMIDSMNMFDNMNMNNSMNDTDDMAVSVLSK